MDDRGSGIAQYGHDPSPLKPQIIVGFVFCFSIGLAQPVPSSRGRIPQIQFFVRMLLIDAAGDIHVPRHNQITSIENESANSARRLACLCRNDTTGSKPAKNKENKTRVMMSTVAGWGTGMGYDLKIKPESWASSSIADNHTK